MKFGEALELLKEGYPVKRVSWGDKYVIKQINTDINKSIVPNMSSLPNLAKDLILGSGDGSIHYREQCILVELDNNSVYATNYIPDWIDIFSEDWTPYGL